MTRTIEEALRGYSMTALQAIARYHGIPVISHKRADLEPAILKQQQTEKGIQRALAGLSKRDRIILDRLLLRGGDRDARAFERELELLRLISERPQDAETRGATSDGAHFDAVIARLAERGIAFGQPHHTNAKLDLAQIGRRIFIPKEIVARLPEAKLVLPKPEPIRVTQPVELAPETFQRDLYRYLSFAKDNALELNTRGELPKRVWSKIAGTLTIGEAIDVSAERELGRTYFLRVVLQELGLLKADANVLAPGRDALAFLSLPVAERTRRALQAWLGSERWNEVTRLPTVKVPAPGNLLRDVATQGVLDARRFVVSLVGDLPAEQWMPISHLLLRALLVDYEFLLPRDYRSNELESHGWRAPYFDHSPYHPHGNAIGLGFGGLKDDDTAWQAVEGGFIASALCGPLHWLGLVALGVDDEQALAFKISRLAVRLIRGEPLPVDPAPANRVVVQPNFQIFAFDPIGEDVLANLDRFASLVRAEQAMEYQLTRESVYRAQQEGMAIEEVVAFLEEVAGRDLPQNVLRTLQEWQSHHERIVVRRGVNLIHAADPAVLDALFADGAFRAAKDRRLTPNTALLTSKAKGLSDRVRPLLDRGHVPAVSDKPAARAGKVLGMAADGQIRFRQALPDIYVWRRVAAFTEHRDGELWLTPRSVREAAEGGIGAEKILSELELYHSGPIADETADRIKAWAKHWGDASLNAMTVLRVRDENVLSELRDDPAIGPLLRPFVPDGALAVVSEEDAARLREALEAKGIEVR